MLFLSECRGVLGSDEFVEWIRYRQVGQMADKLRKRFIVSGHTALCLLMKTKKFKIHMFSTLNNKLVRRLGGAPVSRISIAVEGLLGRMSAGSMALILQRGWGLLPRDF